MSFTLAKEYHSMPVSERSFNLNELSTKEQFRPPEESNLPEELIYTYKLSKALNTFLADFIRIEKDEKLERFENPEYRKELIRETVAKFEILAIDKLEDAKGKFDSRIKSNPKNVYELGGAKKLAFSNNATRLLSTTMGLLWERIADLSPMAVNPEAEFGIKLNGVDAIVMDVDDNLVYSQIKTQRNTLTGSQKNRSVAELTLHNNRQMVACFNTSANWTFKSSLVPRVCGEEFWSQLGFEYDEIVDEVKRLMPLMDEEFVKMFDNDNTD